MNVALAPDRHPRTERIFLGPKLLRASHVHGRPEGGIGHWCPGCGVLHVIAPGIENRGTLATPDFDADFDLKWRGFGLIAPGGRCHYRIVLGLILFGRDCTHRLACITVPLPDLPGHLRE